MTFKGNVSTHLGIAVLVKTDDGDEKFLPIPLNSGLVVGDRVEIDGTKIHRLERRNLLQRSTVKKGTQILAANLDSLIIVICAKPETTAIFLEQAIIAASIAHIKVLIAVNKGDQPENKELCSLMMKEYDPFVPSILVSAKTGLGIDGLKRYISKSGRCILAGVSGVGKSSLANALQADAHLPTGSISGNSGTHTTSKSTLHNLEGGGELIDSPGVRNFTPVNLTKLELAKNFTGFAQFLEQGCKFRDCLHLNEPDCAIKKALSKKLIPATRYGLYLKMQEATQL